MELNLSLNVSKLSLFLKIVYALGNALSSIPTPSKIFDTVDIRGSLLPDRVLYMLSLFK